MIVVANMLGAVAIILGMILGFLKLVIIAEVIISWVSADPYNPIVRFVQSITSPLFQLVRRVIPTRFGSIDFAPFVVLLLLVFLEYTLVQTLQDYAQSLRLTAIRGG